MPIAKGSDVALLLGAANRDERKYKDPDKFDIFRESKQHVGFGFGIHVCLGMHLARMETRVAMNTLLDRLGRACGSTRRPTRTSTSGAWLSVRPSPCPSPLRRPDPEGQGPRSRRPRRVPAVDHSGDEGQRRRRGAMR